MFYTHVNIPRPSAKTIQNAKIVVSAAGVIAGAVFIVNGVKDVYQAITAANEDHCRDDGSMNAITCSGFSNYCEQNPDSIFC